MSMVLLIQSGVCENEFMIQPRPGATCGGKCETTA
jgi:hypothetical protein